MAALASPGERGLPADSNAGSPSPQPNNASELGATFVPVAWVRAAEGGTVLRSDGSTASLEKGLLLFAGDVIETGEGGTVVVALTGGSGFALGEGARVVLSERDGDAGADLVVLRGAAVVIADPDGGADGPLVAMLAMTLQLDGPNASVFLQQAGPESLVTLLPGGGPGASAAAYNQAGVAALDTPYATLVTSSVSDPPDSAPRPSVETIALLFSQAAVPDAGSAQSTEAGGTDLTPVGETLAEIAPAAGDPAFSPDGPFVLASELDLGELFARVSAIELDAPVFQSAAVTRAARPAHRREPVPTATSADAPPNAEPEVASPLADVTVDEDAPDTAIDLGHRSPTSKIRL